jgi:hypothetical protein
MPQRDPFRIFPRATAEQRHDLRASLTAVGLKNPVVVDEDENVIDGHERRDGCLELGVDWLAGADVRVGLTEIQKKSLAIELNLWRRPIHLTRQQRNQLLDVYLIANPHLSETQVANLFGVDQSTVNRRKRALMRSHKLPQVVSTVGRDGVTRKIGDRKRTARVVVKSKAEYERLRPTLVELRGEVQGLIRRPHRLQAIADRKLALAEVNAHQPARLPETITIKHCDFRHLELADNSVDLIVTDVVWSPDAEADWVEVGRLASRWLKDDGLFCSIIGTGSYPRLCGALAPSRAYQWTICLTFPKCYRSMLRNLLESWRPIPIFSKAPTSSRIDGWQDMLVTPRPREKKFHDWQQDIEVSIELLRRLSRPGDVIVDPFLGTGTNGVACALLGDRTFVGCDIDEQQVRTARYRVAHEGFSKTG